MVPHSFPVSWEDLHRDARALAWRLATMPKFDRVVAIARGGLAPAAIIAGTPSAAGEPLHKLPPNDALP